MPAASSREVGLLQRKVARLVNWVNFLVDGRGCRHHYVPTIYWVPHKHGGSVVTSFGDRNLGTDAGFVTTTVDQQIDPCHQETSVPWLVAEELGAGIWHQSDLGSIPVLTLPSDAS